MSRKTAAGSPRIVAIACAVLMITVGLSGPVASAQTSSEDVEEQFEEWESTSAETELSEDTVQSFLEAWRPRILDHDRFQAYLEADGIPQDIQDEGFHDLEPAAQKALAHKLIASVITHPDMQTSLEGLTAEEQQAKLDSYARSAYLAIFQKDKMKQALQQSAQPDSQNPQINENPTSDLTERLDAVRSETITPLQQHEDLNPSGEQTVTRHDLAKRVPDRLEVPQPQTVDADNLTKSVDVEPNSIEHKTDSHDPLPEPPEPVPGLELDRLPIRTPVPQLDATEMLELTRNVVDSTTYNVCAVSPTMDLNCSQPLVLGTPYTADVDGDGVPDVSAQLRPDVDQEHPTGFSGVFEVRRTDATSDEPLPGHVFAVFEGPTTFKRFNVGFDGTDDTLADEASLSVTLKEPAKAFKDDVRIELDLNTTNPGDRLGVSFASMTLEPTDLQGRQPGVASSNSAVPGTGDPNPVDPVVGTLDFAPVPTNLTVDARILDREGDARRMAFNLSQEQASVVEGDIVMRRTEENRTRMIHTRVDPLPAQVNVSFETEAVGATEAHYLGSEKIDEFVFSDKLIYDAAEPETYRTLSALVKDIPKEIRFQLEKPFQAKYKASDQLTEAAVSIEEFEKGELQTRMAGFATDIPDEWTIKAERTNDGTLWTYDAEQRLGSVGFQLVDNTDKTERIRANLLAEDIPRHMELERAGQAIDFGANGDAIGTITASFSKNDGTAFALRNDHATLVKQGNTLGAHLKISGLSSFHMDPQDGGHYAIGLEPGGQPFDAFVNIDDEKIGTLHVDALPSQIDVDMTSEQNTFGYEADARIPGVSASYQDRTKGLLAFVSLDGLPQTIDVSWSDNDPRNILYEASGPLDNIFAFYRENPGGTTFALNIDKLPRVIEATISDDLIDVTTRSQPGGADGSGSIGEIHARMGANGLLPFGTPSEDHALLRSDGSLQQASLRYSGFADLEVHQNGDTTTVHLDNEARQLFLVDVQTPDATLTGKIDKVPKTIDLTLRDNFVDYSASSQIGLIELRVERPNGDFVDAKLTQVTDQLTMDLSPDTRKISWRASGSGGFCLQDPILLSSTCIPSTAEVAAQLTESGRTWDMTASITDIPAKWDLRFPQGEVEFDAISSPIGKVEATITNHGSVDRLSGNHLSVNQIGNRIDASFRMTDIDYVRYTETGNGFDTVLKMGGGQPFTIDAEIRDFISVAEANIRIDPLPQRIQVTQNGDKLTYDASDNFDLNAKATVGHAAAADNVPNPPNVRGLSVRDGFGCGFFIGCGDAVTAEVFLEGFPTHLEMDPSSTTYSVDNFKPPESKTVCGIWGCFQVPTDFLELDVLVDDVTNQRINLWARQNDIPSPVDIQFGPIDQTDNGDVKRTDVHYESSDPLGKFEAQARIGADFGDLLAELEISNIPDRIDATIKLGEDKKTVSLDNSAKVNKIRLDAAAKTNTDELPVTINADATLQLTDVPRDVSLTFGQVTNGDDTLPGFSYHASSGTLDILADVEGTVFFKNGDASAKARFGVTNFAQDTVAQLDGSDLKVNSNGKTDNIELHVSGRMHYGDGDKVCFPGCGKSFRAELKYQYGLDASITDFWIQMTNVRSLTVKPGVMTEIDGNFGSVGLGWQNLHVDASASGDADVVVDLGVDTWSVDVLDLSVSINTDINIDFHTYRQTRHTWKSWDSGIPCEVAWDPDTWHVDLDLKPKYTGETSNSFSVSSHSVVLPDPGLLGGAGARVVGVLASPLDSGAWITTSCEG